MGALLGAEFLAAVGSETAPFAAPDRPAAFAAPAPAPPDSGTLHGNLHQPQQYHRGVQRVFCTSALISTRSEPNSRRFHDRKRAEGPWRSGRRRCRWRRSSGWPGAARRRGSAGPVPERVLDQVPRTDPRHPARRAR
ncbi:transposase [Streptomyces sp. WM6378]|uniref:transposase n=1 Tax=Streptomyces sp. WM6378 TaxID=1415557 RepID=UPI003B634F7E